MDQSLPGNDKPNNSEPSQFDYSGLTPPESMGGKQSFPQSGNRPIPPVVPPPPAATGPASSSAPVPPRGLVFPQNSSSPPTIADKDLENPPASPRSSSVGSWLLISILFILLILAVLVFLSWKGYINLGGVEKLWGGGSIKPSPVAISPTESPLSNDATRKKDLATLQLALKKYFADNGAYPISSSKIKTSDQSSVLAQALVPTYLSALPDDPAAPQYYYGYSSDGKTFALTAVLDNKTDKSGTLNGNLNVYTVTDSSGQ